MNLTVEQKKAVNTRNTNILVSAGAGSGKTFVLKTRVLGLINDGVNVDELLILTFTNAAALEMKTRIADVLKSNEKLDQLYKINIANISTFDSFFLKVVNEYHYLLGLKQNLKVGDSVFLDMVLSDIIEEEFESSYNDENFVKLLNNYTVFDDHDLKTKFKIIVRQKSNFFNEPISQISDQSFDVMFNEFYSLIKNKIDLVEKNLNELKNKLTTEAEFKYEQKLSEYLYSLLSANNYDAVYNFFLSEEKYTRVCKTENEEIKLMHNQIKNIVNDIKEMCEFDELNYRNNYLSTASFVNTIWEAVKRVEKKYLEFKIENNIFDFADITKFAIELIDNHELVLNEVKSKFKEIMVDEFQDTNDFQTYFLNKISNNNLYMVGDIKQSIYGFRNANPKNFYDIEQLYKKDENAGTVVNLMDNFRSRDEVLKGINIIFEKIMSVQFGGVEYDDSQMLKFGNKVFDLKNENQNYDFELLTYEVERYVEEVGIDKKYIEPFIVGLDIKNKVDNKHQILDMKTGNLRDCNYGDFAILTRTKSKYDNYVKVLEFLSIVVDSQKEPDFKNNDTVIFFKNVFSYVSTFSKEKKRINLAAILRNYLIQSSDSEIESYLINEIESELITNVIEKLDELIKVRRLSLEFLFDQILDLFDVYGNLSKAPSVNGVVERILQIRSICIEFDDMGYGIDKVNEYFSHLEESENMDVVLSFNKPDTKAVQIMTIHKSKGLEFPIVYLPELKSSFHHSNKETDFLISDKYGVCIPSINGNLKSRQFTELLIKKQLKNEELSESLRLLYVALTRAKEQFIMVGPNELDGQSIIDDSSNFIQALNCVGDELLISQKNIIPLEFDIFERFKVETSKKVSVNYKPMGNEYSYNPLTIDVSEKTFSKASHDIEELVDESLASSINLGTKIHNVLELVDFKNYTPVADERINNIILNMKKYDEFNSYINIYRELEFYHENVHGFIDCLLEFEDRFVIVDYKLKNVDNDKYNEQLKIYQNYIEANSDKPVQVALYSLLEDRLKYL